MANNNFLDIEEGRRSEDTLISSSGSPPEYDDYRREKEYSFPSTIPEMFTTIPSSPRKFGVLPRIRHTLTNLMMFLLPSFITSYINPQSPQRPRKLSSTAWLDGLRGIACFIVVIYHSTYVYFASQEKVYDGVKNTSYLQLPIVKLLHSGPPMVKIFYIISGFALTYKAVGITRVSGPIDGQALLANLSSSVWKRYLRLYLPCAASFVVCAFIVSMGMFELVPKNNHPRWIRGKNEPRPPMETNLIYQLVFAFWDFHQFAVEVTFFSGTQSYVSDVHLWTIPVEFRESIKLFVLVAAGCIFKRRLRVYVLMPLLFSFLMYHANWEFSLFLFGYMLAELHSDIMQNSISLSPDSSASNEKPRGFRLSNILYPISMFAGLYLISYPYISPDPDLTTGYGFLYKSTPKNFHRDRKHDYTHDFWQSLGACLLVWSLMHLPRLQTMFLCNGPVQYLGKISFSLYLLHGHVNRSLGFHTVTSGWDAAGIWYWDEKRNRGEVMNGNEGVRAMVIFMAFFLTTPVSIWCADIFWRAVDMQSVKFLRWLESKVKR